MLLEKSSRVFSSVSWFEEVDSTNLELERQLDTGASEFSAVIAGSQTNGQGRLGRAWQSPSGSSLSLSVSINWTAQDPGWLTLIAALAVTRALRSFGVDNPEIKWPNDVLVSGRKISGILAQLRPQRQVILGIGLNLGPQSSDLAATSLIESGVEVDLDTAASEIGIELRGLVQQFATEPKSVMAEFTKACMTLGQSVRAELPGGKNVYGVASEIGPSGQLVILTPEPVSLSAGDVWHLRG